MIQHLRKYFLQNMLFYYDFFFDTCSCNQSPHQGVTGLCFPASEPTLNTHLWLTHADSALASLTSIIPCRLLKMAGDVASLLDRRTT